MTAPMVSENASRLTRWHRRLIEWTCLALALSGLIWMAMWWTITLAPEYDGPEARSWLHLDVMAHGVIAYLGVAVLGGLFGRHIPAGLKSGRKLLSGLAALAFGALLLATGLLLYYSGDPDSREIASWLHQILGVASVAIVTFHIAATAKRRQNKS